MPLRIAILMDDPAAIKPYKDSSFAMLLEAQRRGHLVYFIAQEGLALRDGRAEASARTIAVKDQKHDFVSLGPSERIALATMDIILSRKDPPFDSEYLYDTQVLELAEAEGVLVVNSPQALRDANEKLYALHFPQCCPPTLVAREAEQLREFVLAQGEVVIKPLDGMGGRGIFRSHAGDPNLNVILESVSHGGSRLTMIQRYLPEIRDGDKRILLIDGEPVPYALARIPGKDDFRGNLARGGRGRGQPLSERDRWICAEVGPELKRRGLIFVGLDVIGDYLTEINVTSPTCIRELDAEFGLNIAGTLFDCLEARCPGR